MVKIVVEKRLRPDSLNFVKQRWNSCVEIEINDATCKRDLIDLNRLSAILLVTGDEIIHYNISDLVRLGLSGPGQIHYYAELSSSTFKQGPKTYSHFPGKPEKLPNPVLYHDAFFSQAIYFLPHNSLSDDFLNRSLFSVAWDLVPMPRYHTIFPLSGGRNTLFLDRDGIVNVDKSYVYKIEDCDIIPEIYSILEWAKQNNFETAILTNQSGIGRGMYTCEDANRIHQWMDQHFREKGIPVGSFEMAPFHHQGQEGPFKKHSHLRKPCPGMALKVGERIPIDLHRSFMIGDKISDLLWLPLIKGYLLKGKYELGPDVFSCQNLSEVLKNLQKDYALF